MSSGRKSKAGCDNSPAVLILKNGEEGAMNEYPDLMTKEESAIMKKAAQDARKLKNRLARSAVPIDRKSVV
jgi:hypothetical protein